MLPLLCYRGGFYGRLKNIGGGGWGVGWVGGWEGKTPGLPRRLRLLAMTAVFIIARPASPLVIASPAGAWRSRVGGRRGGVERQLPGLPRRFAPRNDGGGMPRRVEPPRNDKRNRHREGRRPVAIQSGWAAWPGAKAKPLDCRVASLLAMTALTVIASPAGAWRSRVGGEAWGVGGNIGGASEPSPAGGGGREACISR